MRILNLNLERFGPFTGRTLTFRPDAKLHIVYGPNEAGKSCSLAAVTDLLFGIDRQTGYDFLHDSKELRIGATIAARNGNQLSFRRRKGNKNTLVDADDRALGDDALLPFLGNLSRDVFCRAFGLNTPSLRSGAEEMLNSQGDVGASLVAACLLYTSPPKRNPPWARPSRRSSVASCPAPSLTCIPCCSKEGPIAFSNRALTKRCV